MVYVKLIPLLVCVFSLFACDATTEQISREDKDAAVSAARSWVGLFETGSFESSWDAASPFFKKAVKKTQWVNSISGVVSGLGRLKTREVSQCTFMRKPPGAPEGEYVVIVFESSYEKKPKAIETVTMKKGDDGAWQGAGYFIK